MSEDESRRAIRRMEEQQEKLFSGHAPATDTDDPIERLGRRIARIVSYGLAAGLVWYLWTTFRH